MLASPRARLVFLDWLRALAALLVVWDHLVGQWLSVQRRGWVPQGLVDRFVTGPLSIIQNFGWLGVAMFFLISGFIISHVAVTESGSQFALKRLLRIYPPLVLAIIVTLGADAIRRGTGVVDSLSGGLPVAHSVHDVLASMSLANYVMYPQPIVLGVAWTLVIEMTFYMLVLTTKRLLNWTVPAVATWIMLAVVGLILLTSHRLGTSYFLFSVSVSYVPLLVLGQIIWLRWSSRIGWAQFGLLSVTAWVLFVHGLELIQPRFLQPGQAYGPSIFVAYAIFVLMLLNNDRLHRPSFVKFLANRSYSLYLLHGALGLFVLDALGTRLPYTLALIVAVAVVVVGTQISYKLVEEPSQRLARKLSAKLARPRPTGDEVDAVLPVVASVSRTP
jgi:exopolysaccharide production protein ExoZ